MANKFSIFILCLALVVVYTKAAREMPSDNNGISDQKNVIGGAGSFGGIGSNGLPFGGVVSGVGGDVGGFGAGVGGGAGFGGGLGGGGLGGVGGGIGGLGGLGGLGGGYGGGAGAGTGGAGNLPLP